MSAGVLTEQVVEDIRTGAISDPTVKQVAALAAAFGLPPSYLLDRGQGSLAPRRGATRGPARRDDSAG